MGDSSLQNHSGANLNPKRAKNRDDVPKGGEAGGVALTAALLVFMKDSAHKICDFSLGKSLAQRPRYKVPGGRYGHSHGPHHIWKAWPAWPHASKMNHPE
jgi:hypothetical protein